MRTGIAVAVLVLCSAGGLVACGTDAGGTAPGRTADAQSDVGNALDSEPWPDAPASDAPAEASAAADVAAEAAVDHSDQLPAGVTPPPLWFWRGINQNNLGNWRTMPDGRRCADGDTTMWFRSPGNSACQGAPACDPGHFGTQAAPCTGVDCCWRNWDDPRGPEFRVSKNTGPVDVKNWGAKSVGGGTVPGYGFEVTVCAKPGTVADIDTCPRPDLYSCVEDNYPQFVDQCTPVLLKIQPKAGTDPSVAGCYSNINSNVTITF